MDELKSFLNQVKENWQIAVILFSVAGLCLLLWKTTSGGLSDFGLNAFTETLGIVITVFLIDYLIKKREGERLLPQEAASYEDVRMLTSRIVSFWTEIHKSCMPELPPDTWKDFFSKENLTRIGNCLNMDSQPNVIPRRTWWEWFPTNMKDFEKRAQVILERHNRILDPVAYLAVHKIATVGINSEMMESIRKVDIQTKFPRIKVLSNYYLISDDYFENVILLIEWCRTKAQYLESKKIDRLRSLPTDKPDWSPNTNPPCMISKDELEKQMKELDEFHRNNKSLDI